VFLAIAIKKGGVISRSELGHDITHYQK
jgi:hypothetical protein